MKYCINCGREIRNNHTYCAVCGAYQHPKGNNGGGYRNNGSSLRENDKALAVISYIGILSLVSYFVAPKTSPYARFHAVQGLNLFIFECILSVSNTLLRGIFSWAWPIRTILTGATSIAGIALFVLAIIGIVNASKGEMTELPVVGSLGIVKE